MASRVGGAVTALAAAVLLAVSITTSAWWSGHPTINGQSRHMQDVYVGLHGAELCNTGGDGTCKAMPLPNGFAATAYAELAVSLLLLLGMLAMAGLVWTRRDLGKTLAKVCLPLAGIAAILAALLVIQGPSRQAAVPIGFGLYLFWAGAGLSMIASVLALRQAVGRRLHLAPSRQSDASAGAAAHLPYDVHALLQDDALRPSEPRIAPRPSGRAAPGLVQSPGGVLAGPSGPLGAAPSPASQPLFSSAPQLRPLYDAAPDQGGTGGFRPNQPGPVAMQPPAPMPRHQISAHVGITTPPALEAQRPVTVAGMPPGNLAPVVKGKTIPPPARAKAPTLPPPAGAPASRDLGGPPPRDPGTPPAHVPPPHRPVGRTTPPSAPSAPRVAPLPRSTGRTVPPPVHRTLATAAVPPPPNATLAEPPRPPARAMLPTRMTTDPDGHETGDFDGAATYAVAPQAAATSATPAVTPHAVVSPLAGRSAASQVAAPLPRSEPPRLFSEGSPGGGDPDTDLHPGLADPGATGESFELATSESAIDEPSPPATTAAAEAPLDRARPEPASDEDELLTLARPKLTSTDLDLPVTAAPTTGPAALSTSESRKPAEPASAETATERPPAKVSMSTAPESLPPPSEKQAASSGPSPACPQCEAPMAWVEAHLRFYCKSCKMYF